MELDPEEMKLSGPRRADDAVSIGRRQAEMLGANMKEWAKTATPEQLAALADMRHALVADINARLRRANPPHWNLP